MYVHFDLPCEGDTQKKLHRTFRHKIREWKSSGIVTRAVLTYHISVPTQPTDSLYVCIDIPTVERSTESRIDASQEWMKRIPLVLVRFFDDVCRENNIKLTVIDYEAEAERVRKGYEEKAMVYYEGLSVEEVIRCASIGTEIALEVIDHLERDEKAWNLESELDFVFSRLRAELGVEYPHPRVALHFVSNPLHFSTPSDQLSSLLDNMCEQWSPLMLARKWKR